MDDGEARWGGMGGVRPSHARLGADVFSCLQVLLGYHPLGPDPVSAGWPPACGCHDVFTVSVVLGFGLGTAPLQTSTRAPSLPTLGWPVTRMGHTSPP